MKVFTKGMTEHINQAALNLAGMWKITRADGVIFTFTDHDQDIVYNGRRYKADSGFNRSSISAKADLSVDHMDLQGILKTGDIVAQDIRAGRFDGAEVEIFLINHREAADPPGIYPRAILSGASFNVALNRIQLVTPGSSWVALGFKAGDTISIDNPTEGGTQPLNEGDFVIDSILTTTITDDTIDLATAPPAVVAETGTPTTMRIDSSKSGRGMGIIKLRRGCLGEIRILDDVYEAEIRGMTQTLTRALGEVTQPLCRVDLYSTRCGLVSSGTNTVDAIAFKESDTVVSVDDGNRVITVDGGTLTRPDGDFDQGLLTWTGGLNSGLSFEVKVWDAVARTIELFLPAPYTIVAADAFDIFQGCGKTFAVDCVARFDNGDNFRGEPLIPGNDLFFKTPDAKLSTEV